MPLGLGAAAVTVFAAVTKPFRLIQELSSGGSELFVIARKPN
jgi:hypothetical protein